MYVTEGLFYAIYVAYYQKIMIIRQISFTVSLRWSEIRRDMHKTFSSSLSRNPENFRARRGADFIVTFNHRQSHYRHSPC